ncbi:MAG: MCE family protein [Planctomycetia bacterium]|uniref:Mce/MlaD domain-containing protein n=1 Tax=Candidatus Brocadia sapporoensis TaxID=392547 RepID=A0A1V6LYV8_9BACT|nr:MlaD family protein [Candidatus Brocadia sapporoensis]MCC7239626.1 MCE family protein [Candidatus Brocadia sp.]QOJ05106.1 MAG: MCE family protein [Planctomycetia bacterium]TVL98017.1 MAG: MCE family protein [Candidatus Brocadia sp. BL1]MDG6005444.1 MCE family protein [Candidatus Brocadia sp.]OQD45276.1 hypothetical protein BIY37_09100 [Candidatus Brocadia sapporoensis]
MTKEQFAELRAGFFTLVTLAGFGAMVFILGTQKGYFEPQIILKTRFVNVYGLKAGAPVRFMGVAIGQVKDVLLPKELPCAGIEVILKVDKSAQKNINHDSVATIKWLSYVTGDSYVEITSGESNEPAVEDGDSIKSSEPISYTTAIEGGISMVKSFSGIVKKLEEGRFIESFNSISASLDESVKALQKGDGLLSALIYDPKGKQLLENLVKTTETLNEITGKIANGEGTLGAMISDPTLYENLKRLLGGAERSFVLRNLIRRSIEKGKEER